MSDGALYTYVVGDIVERTGLRETDVRAILRAYTGGKGRGELPGGGTIWLGARYSCDHAAYRALFGTLADQRVEQRRIEAQIVIARAAAALEEHVADGELRLAAARERLARVQEAARTRRGKIRGRARIHGWRPAPYRLRPIDPVRTLRDAAKLVGRAT